jgi:hypothetical protein
MIGNRRLMQALFGRDLIRKIERKTCGYHQQKGQPAAKEPFPLYIFDPRRKESDGANDNARTADTGDVLSVSDKKEPKKKEEKRTENKEQNLL